MQSQQNIESGHVCDLNALNQTLNISEIPPHKLVLKQGANWLAWLPQPQRPEGTPHRTTRSREAALNRRRRDRVPRDVSSGDPVTNRYSRRRQPKHRFPLPKTPVAAHPQLCVALSRSLCSHVRVRKGPPHCLGPQAPGRRSHPQPRFLRHHVVVYFCVFILVPVFPEAL